MRRLGGLLARLFGPLARALGFTVGRDQDGA